MRRRLTIRQVFAAVIAAAIALAPSSRLTMAAQPSDAPAMAHEMVMPADDAHDMMQDMAMSMSGDEAVAPTADQPCCPQQAPHPVDCDKCGAMAGCTAQCFSGMTASAGYLLPLPAAAVIPQRDEARPASLGRPPPEYPPRSLV